MTAKLIGWTEKEFEDHPPAIQRTGLLISRYEETTLVTEIKSNISEHLYCSFEVRDIVGDKISFTEDSLKLAAHLAVQLPTKIEALGEVPMPLPIAARITRCAGELLYKHPHELEFLNDTLIPVQDPQESLGFK